MAIFYIYGLIDPSVDEIFYIGQTICKPNYRLINHIGSAKNNNTPVYIKIKNMVLNKLRPKVVTLREINGDMCIITNDNPGLFYEKIYIEEYSILGTLLNIIHNPLYDKKNKVFIQPKFKGDLRIENGRYFIDSDRIKYLHKEKYNPFNNHRFIIKSQANYKN